MFNLETNETLKTKIENEYIENPKKEFKYRLSIMYFFRSFILIVCIFMLLIYSFTTMNFSSIDSNLVLRLVLELLLIVYILFNLYTIFNYIVVIDENYINTGKKKIIISDIKRLTIKDIKFRGSKYEKALSLVSKDGSEYMFRLNISYKIRFIKQISELTNLKVEFSE
ncbi:hypothetical protein [Pseudostreptobacillus hongkongensis]|uniref:hypothetical protein n=1 Tax=Pseudostreptobacillus hongkongensis TaxID=1162717 RepID=UPI00082968B0|nr:hypothetical protein [Pseudostreptobacillus hongkongensis]